MRLVDEIEAAANPERQATAMLLRWHRIKAALLAGEEMAGFVEQQPTACSMFLQEYARRFRAATEGTGKDGLHVGDKP